MAEEPPTDFVNFVAVHLRDLQTEAARLVGGPQYADEVYPMALSDVAGHWRRLRWRSRITRRDTTGEFLLRRLAARAKQWREEQIYDVDVHLLRPPVYTAPLPASYALRKAGLIPSTERIHSRPLAEASIAWSHAFRRAYWRRIGRTAGVIAVIFLVFAQLAPALPD
jgi:hypothetical protein